jgi:hypothetical protein
VEQKRPPAFVLMDNEEFQKLSTDEKAAYLIRAVEALKNGNPVVTPNGPFGDAQD